jgi:6-phosphogluconolactonase
VHFEWRTFPDPNAAALACAAHIVEHLDDAMAARGYATLALSGGSTPKLMFAQMATSRLGWDRVHIFWVDERAVPPTDPDSNFKLAAESLLNFVAIPQGNIHRIHAELAPAAAARAYSQEIREFFGLARGEMPEFDVVHRGMGPDAHTASLFPGDPLIGDREEIDSAVFVPCKAQWRITLLPGPLLAARKTAMLVTGADKAETLRTVFQGPYDPLSYPAQLAPPAGRGMVWFVDEAAARLLADA